MGVLIFILLSGGTVIAQDAVPSPQLKTWNLEIGLGVGGSLATQGFPGPLTGRAMFSGTFGYQFGKWLLGVNTRGGLATEEDVETQTQDTLIRGEIKRRIIEYGPILRRYLETGSYFQVGAGLAYSELLTDTNDESEKYLAPNPTPFADRVYINGTWVQLAFGHEFKGSPWFARAEYTYAWFHQAKIVGRQEGLNRVLHESALISRPHEQILTLTAGLVNIF